MLFPRKEDPPFRRLNFCNDKGKSSHVCSLVCSLLLKLTFITAHDINTYMCFRHMLCLFWICTPFSYLICFSFDSCIRTTLLSSVSQLRFPNRISIGFPFCQFYLSPTYDWKVQLQRELTCINKRPIKIGWLPGGSFRVRSKWWWKVTLEEESILSYLEVSAHTARRIYHKAWRNSSRIILAIPIKLGCIFL